MPSLSRALRRVTIGDEDTRVRATWRAVAPWCLGFGVQPLALTAILLTIRSVLDLSELGDVAISLTDRALFGVASALGLLLVVLLATRLDERPISAYGLGTFPDWVAGLGIGGLTYAVPTALLLQLGEAELTAPVPFPADAPSVIALAVAVTVMAFVFQVAFEEFAFRGVMLKNFAEGLSARGVSRDRSAVLALLFSSLVFGVSHVIVQGGGGTEGRSLQLVITSALLGLLWGGGYVLTGRLAIPFGLHLGYNLWPAVVLQPTEATLGTPALGQVAYSVSQYELTAGKVLVGGVCLMVWLYLTRGELTVKADISEWAADRTSTTS